MRAEGWERRVGRWLPKATLAGAVLILVAMGRPLRLVGNGENMVVFTWGGGGEPDGFAAWSPLGAAFCLAHGDF